MCIEVTLLQKAQSPHITSIDFVPQYGRSHLKDGKPASTNNSSVHLIDQYKKTAREEVQRLLKYVLNCYRIKY